MAKNKRLGDTAKVMATPKASYQSESTYTRKIDNGYITCRSVDNGTECSRTEYYHKDKGGVMSEGDNLMAKAVAYLDRTNTH